MSELVYPFAMLNLAGGAAILAVLALRLPARRLFGPAIAYRLWSLPALATLAMFLPARVIEIPEPAQDGFLVKASAVATNAAPPPPAETLDMTVAVALVWLAGVLASLALLARRQVQFARAARKGAAGPAVVGVLRPRVVAPNDFERRYTLREQLVVLAHEQTHIARHDSRVNALVALVRCLCWFNPLVHVMGHLLRIDQELACDAQVIARHPGARRSYAEAMLKTQLAARPLPLGCYWPEQSAHPLAERIRLLGRNAPSRRVRWIGAAAVVALGVVVAWSAYASRRPEVVYTAAEARLAYPQDAAEVAAVQPVSNRPRAAPALVAPLRAAKPAPAPEEPVAEAAAAMAAEADRMAAGEESMWPARDRMVALQARLVDPDATVRLRLPPRPAPAPLPPRPAPAAPAAPAAPPGYVLVPAHAMPDYVLVPAAALNQPYVEPGYAIRLDTRMVAPDGKLLESKMTSYGSGTGYRDGSYRTNGSRYGLRTKVVQTRERVQIFVSLVAGERALGSGMTTLASGETGQITLSNGQVATVTPTIRLETEQEFAQARAALRRLRR